MPITNSWKFTIKRDQFTLQPFFLYFFLFSVQYIQQTRIQLRHDNTNAENVIRLATAVAIASAIYTANLVLRNEFGSSENIRWYFGRFLFKQMQFNVLWNVSGRRI